MTNINTEELLKITNGQLITGENKNNIGKICIDSRKIEKNDIFVAIKGKKNDGNKYVKEIIDIAGAIITEKKFNIKTKTPIIKVKNVKKTITELGMYYRNKYINKKVIAITGSVGKTTTKEIINTILKEKYKTLKTEGNMNNEIGVPMMLSRIKESDEIIILELGMNHINEIKKLATICKPNIGIITNIGTSHIGNLKTQDNIFKAKMEITEGINNGILIVNGADKYLKTITNNNNYKVIKTDSTKIENIVLDANLTFKLENNTVTFPIPNKYLIDNILIGIEIGKLFNISENEIIKNLNQYKPVEKRMNIIELENNITIIDDSYNACLESVKGALDAIKKQKKEKLIIIGDILELGKEKKKIHDKLKQEIKKIKDLNVISIGKATKNIKKHFRNNKKAIKYLEKENLNNIVILIKGSRKMQLEEIRDYLIKKYTCQRK